MPAPVLQFKRGAFSNLPGLRTGEPGFTTDKYDFYVGLTSSLITNKFFGSARYWKREDATNAAQLRLVDKDGSNFIAIAASDTLSGIATYRLPNTTNGTAGDFLKLSSTTGGVYSLEWAQITSSFTLAGDTGTDTFNTGETLTFTGGTNINSAVTNNTVTFNLDDDINISGIGTFGTGAVIDGVQIGISGANVIDTVSGNLTLNSAGGSTIIDDAVTIQNNLVVNGNVTVGGTTVTLRGEDVFIENKDIILGFTTSITPNDDTANHAGVAIASTIGSPLVSFDASGINTLPSTYKQLMWFKSGTLGFSTDAFAFNYGLAIGTTTMANGVRLAVGSGITMSDNAITVTDLNTNSSTASLFNANATTVNAFQAATNIVIGADTGITTFRNSVRVSDSLYDSNNNAGVSGQFLTVTGAGVSWTTIAGVAAGTISTATTATTVTTTGTSDNATYYVTFVDTSGGQTGETLRVGTALSLNASSGNVKAAGDLIAGSGYLASSNGTRSMYMYDTSGDVSFQGKVVANNFRSSSNASNTLTFTDLDASFARNLSIAGITTIGTGVGITQFSSSVSTGNSTSSVPTSSAVIDYIGSQISSVDLTLGINADTGGPSAVTTSQTLTLSGTASEVETSVSGQTITIGLPNDVVVGTSLSSPTLRTNLIKSSDTNATAITIAGSNVTIGGDLIVQGNTTQLDTATLTVEDRTIELGRVPSGQPTTTTWDLAVLFNYGDGSAKKAGVVWEASTSTRRFQFTTDVNPGSDGGSTDTNLPQFTVTNFAPIEVSSLWINGCGSLGALEVIKCNTTEIILQDITIDAGSF